MKNSFLNFIYLIIKTIIILLPILVSAAISFLINIWWSFTLIVTVPVSCILTAILANNKENSHEKDITEN